MHGGDEKGAAVSGRDGGKQRKRRSGRLTDGAARCERAEENPTVVGIVVRQSTND